MAVHAPAPGETSVSATQLSFPKPVSLGGPLDTLSCIHYFCGPHAGPLSPFHDCPAVTWPDIVKMGMYSARRTTRTIPPTRTIIAGSRKLIIVITVVSTFFS